MAGELRVGTSGFSFAEWKGNFYPQKLSNKKMLAFYSERMNTVEINSSFYRVPTEKALSDWAREVPDGFRFSLKASRYLTHGLKLKDAGDALLRFYGVAAALGPKLGPLFVQVPAFVSKDVATLRAFLEAAPRGKQIAIDFRDPSWRDPLVYAEMEAYNAAWVIADLDEEPGHRILTADWTYLRLRKAIYSNEEIHHWARWLRTLTGGAFVYFKHEDEGLGPRLAEQLKIELGAIA